MQLPLLPKEGGAMPRVEHLCHQALETYLTRLLPIEVNAVSESHLRQCGSCVAQLTQWTDFATLCEIPAPPPEGQKDLRRNPRFQTNGSGLFQILKPSSSQWWDIRITNVSRDGMRLNIPFRVPQGSLTKVKVKNSLYFGETRYCEPASDDLFYVGIHLHVFYTHGRLHKGITGPLAVQEGF
jgi:hypothetical protein